MPFVITDAQFLLLVWIPTTLTGMCVALRFMFDAAADKAFLRSRHLNGVREIMVDINFAEAFSHFVFKFVYGALGVWALILRVQNPAPLTQIGWITFLTLFIPILWITLTDLHNYHRKRLVIKGLVRDNVKVAPIEVKLPVIVDGSGNTLKLVPLSDAAPEAVLPKPDEPQTSQSLDKGELTI